MFLIYALLAVLLVTAAIYIVRLVFNYKGKLITTIGHWGLCISLALIVVCIVFGASFRNDINGAHERYDELMLYYNTVNYSTNEYVRYDYFDKVEAYNNWYDRLESDSTSWCFNAFFPDNWNADFGPIEFQLNGDSYGLE